MTRVVKCPRCRQPMQCTNPDVRHYHMYYCGMCGLHHIPDNAHPRRLDDFVK